MDTSATHRVPARLISGSIERTEAVPVPYSVDIAAAPNPDIDTPERGPVLQVRVVQWPEDPERQREVIKTFVPNAAALRYAVTQVQAGQSTDFLYPEDAPNWGVRFENGGGELLLRRLDPSSRLSGDDAFAVDGEALAALGERLREAASDLNVAREAFFSEGSPDSSDGQPTDERLG
ncbi:hypothetical protein [Deinococcus sp.]|uniref:hypothetical protein n=1 Tax=Deinococcus sp. TaxID=47478 RepID=UPI0025CF3D0E|nr:hypothetical protein [Deinococcus sp.]